MAVRPANFDPSIDPTADQVRALCDAGPEGPVVILSILKFGEQANYPAGSPHALCSGAEAHRRYQTAFVETVGDVSSAAVGWEGTIDRPFIGDASQDWDKCLLVRYPSRQHFLAMMATATSESAVQAPAVAYPPLRTSPSKSQSACSAITYRSASACSCAPESGVS